MKAINRHIFLLIAMALSGAFLPSCNDELFINPEELEVSVSERILEPTGGMSVVEYGKACGPEPPSISVYIDNGNIYQDIFHTQLIDNKADLSNDFFALSAEFDSKKNTVRLQLGRSLFSDSVYVRIERSSDIKNSIETVIIAPAPDCVVSSVNYNVEYYNENGSINQTRKYTFVNSTDKPQKLSTVVCQMARFEAFADISFPLFGKSAPEIPAAVWDGGKIIVTDDRITIPINSNSVIWNDLEVGKTVEADVPPRCLYQMDADITYWGYSTWVTIYVGNPAFADFNSMIEGEYLLYVPTEIKCRAKTYDLDTGEEIPL